jgi:hypothetical protein
MRRASACTQEARRFDLPRRSASLRVVVSCFMPDNAPRPTRWLDEPGAYGLAAFAAGSIFVGFINPFAGALAGILAGVVVYRWRKRFMSGTTGR